MHKGRSLGERPLCLGALPGRLVLVVGDGLGFRLLGRPVLVVSHL